MKLQEKEDKEGKYTGDLIKQEVIDKRSLSSLDLKQFISWVKENIVLAKNSSATFRIGWGQSETVSALEII